MITQEIENKILYIVNSKKPTTGTQLVEYIIEELSITEPQALKMLVELEDRKKISFNQEKPIPVDLQGFLLSNNARWYQIVMLISFSSVFSVIFQITGTLNFLRNLIGVVYVLFIPGYSVTRILYMSEEISSTKNILFSMAISVSIAAFVGILLNYSSYGITPVPVALAVFIIVLLLSNTAIYMEYKNVIN